MRVYLQPSPVRRMLDATIAYSHRHEGKMPAIDYALSVRMRLVGTALVGIAQTIHCFAIWVILSAASFLTCRRVRQLERATDRVGSLCGAGLVGAMIAATGVFYVPGAEYLSQRITLKADRDFDVLCQIFEHAFDREAQKLCSKRLASAKWYKETVRRDFHDRAVAVMRAERLALAKECRRAYPGDPESKYAAFCLSRARMFELLARQRRELRRLPFTESEADRYYVDKAKVMADNALEDIYAYVVKVWEERIEKWQWNWNREAFAEKMLKEKLFKGHRIDDDVENLVEYVKNAQGKEQAYERFVKDLRSLVYRMKGQINKVENPSIIRRIWWCVQPWISQST